MGWVSTLFRGHRVQDQHHIRDQNRRNNDEECKARRCWLRLTNDALISAQCVFRSEKGQSQS